MSQAVNWCFTDFDVNAEKQAALLSNTLNPVLDIRRPLRRAVLRTRTLRRATRRLRPKERLERMREC